MEIIRFNLSRAERAFYQQTFVHYQRQRASVDLARGNQVEHVRYGILLNIIGVNHMILTIGQRPYNDLDALRIHRLKNQMDGFIAELIAVGDGGRRRRVIGPNGDVNHPQQ